MFGLDVNFLVFYTANLRKGRLNQIDPTTPYLDVFFLFLNPVEGTQTLLGLAYSIKSMKKSRALGAKRLNRPGPTVLSPTYRLIQVA